MRILITSGGTVVKIDDVRHIGNFSSGSFPAKIATAALAKGHEVLYFHAKSAKLPVANKKLKLIPFETYDEYYAGLKTILNKEKFDVAFLGAAVSDYGLKAQKGKISSVKLTLSLHPFRLPKVIPLVKGWSKTPLFQVGFKLLSGVSDKELIETAYKAGLNDHSDLVIANDYVKIKSGEGGVIIVTPEKGAIKLNGVKLADDIVEFVERRAMAKHFKTVLIKNSNLDKKYREEIKLFKQLCSKLSARNLMAPFFIGTKSGHGSLALRIKNNEFLITSRRSDKKNLTVDDVVLVKKIDWVKRIITVESFGGKKASLNAVLVAKIFEKFPEINAVVHTHSFIKSAPMTKFSYTPGTLDYAIEPVKLLTKKTRAINLKDHGLIAIGEDLKQTVDYVLR